MGVRFYGDFQNPGSGRLPFVKSTTCGLYRSLKPRLRWLTSLRHKDLAMTDRYAHLTNMRKLSRQKALADHYANGNGGSELSGEHIGNTEG